MGVHIKRWVGVVMVCVVIGSLAVAGYIGYVLNRPNDKNSESNGVSEGVISHGAGSSNKSNKQDSSHSSLGLEETLGKTEDEGGLKKCEGREEKCNIRLDPNVIPVHYDLFLYPNISAGLFSGEVKIQLDIQSESVDHVRLHIKNLEVLNTELTFGATDFPVTGFEVVEKEYWVVKSSGDHVFTKGVYELKLSFRGNLTQGITGFYRSTYFDKAANVSKYVVSSKFQPTYARRAFPCFDEPGFKSTFTVTLVKPSELVALSNMPVEEEQVNTPLQGLTTVKFLKSVPMVTYLVAFAIGDFAYKQNMTKRGIPVRIYSTSFQVAHVDYASSITARIIDYYEEYFGVQYPLPKLDVIGIPDFVSGAMEHWGMISFRESNLLYQPGVGSAANKQRVAAVLAHELAHMWFGNLMTLKWWNDLWLNEGFASYMEYKGVNAVHSDWEMENQFVRDDLAIALRLDGMESSHPIVVDVSNPDQITELFDKISYSKGSSVIRMLENFMGRESFRRGIQQFLKKFSFKNAVTNDLWTELQSVAGPLTEFNISLVMDTWTRQMGYPVLSPEKQADGTWKVRQEKFKENRNAISLKKNESPFRYKWEIPISMEWTTKTSGGDSKVVWARHDQEIDTLPATGDAEWLKFNKGQFGYYRVNYGEEMYKALKKDLIANWTPSERCGILDDAFALAYASYLEYNVTLDFIQVLKDEDHFIPWDCSKQNIEWIGNLLKEVAPDAYVKYRQLILSLVSGIYSKLSWNDSESDKHLDRLLKPFIFSMACKNGHKDCLKRTKRMYDSWLANPKNSSLQVPSGLRKIVYQYGTYQADSNSWDKLWNIYLDEADPQERVRLLKALASTKDSTTIRKYLELAKNESLVKRQDYFTVFHLLSDNPVGNPIVWGFYRNQFEYLVRRFTINDRHLGRVIVGITSDYSTQTQLNEVKNFFAKYPEGGAGARARQGAIENIENNIAWANRNAPVIEKWLNEFQVKS